MRSIALAAVLALAAVGGAYAGDRPEAPAVHVSTHGLDLNNSADAQKVYTQLSQAALKVCGAGPHEVFTSDESERIDICYRQTMNDVVAKSGSSALAALNDKHGI